MLCWRHRAGNQLVVLSLFASVPEFRSRDCEEEQEEGEGWAVLLQVWLGSGVDPGMGQ